MTDFIQEETLVTNSTLNMSYNINQTLLLQRVVNGVT